LKIPKRIDLDLQQVDALLKRTKESLPPEDYKIIKAMADTIYLLSQSVNQKAISIQRLLRMLFDTTTEKLEKVTGSKKTKTCGKKEKKKGHGRNAVTQYTSAKKVTASHKTLKPRSQCPACLKGKVYKMKAPQQIVHITGNTPLAATVYKMQRLRCNLCGEIFAADHPECVGEEKYDPASKAVIALLRYDTGILSTTNDHKIALFFTGRQHAGENLNDLLK